MKLENLKIQRLRQELKVKKEQIKLMDLEIAEAEAQPSDNSSSKKDCSECGNYRYKTCSYLFKNQDRDCKAYVKRNPS